MTDRDITKQLIIGYFDWIITSEQARARVRKFNIAQFTYRINVPLSTRRSMSPRCGCPRSPPRIAISLPARRVQLFRFEHSRARTNRYGKITLARIAIGRARIDAATPTNDAIYTTLPTARTAPFGRTTRAEMTTTRPIARGANFRGDARKRNLRRPATTSCRRANRLAPQSHLYGERSTDCS